MVGFLTQWPEIPTSVGALRILAQNVQDWSQLAGTVRALIGQSCRRLVTSMILSHLMEAGIGTKQCSQRSSLRVFLL